MSYTSRPHNTFSTKGKSLWQKVLVVFANITTNWECRVCSTRLPHHPTKGHRMSEESKDTCKTCDSVQKLQHEHEERMRRIYGSN